MTLCQLARHVRRLNDIYRLLYFCSPLRWKGGALHYGRRAGRRILLRVGYFSFHLGDSVIDVSVGAWYWAAYRRVVVLGGDTYGLFDAVGHLRANVTAAGGNGLEF